MPRVQTDDLITEQSNSQQWVGNTLLMFGSGSSARGETFLRSGENAGDCLTQGSSEDRASVSAASPLQAISTGSRCLIWLSQAVVSEAAPAVPCFHGNREESAPHPPLVCLTYRHAHTHRCTLSFRSRYSQRDLRWLTLITFLPKFIRF